MIGATSFVKRFGRHEALRGIDLAIATGELFAAYPRPLLEVLSSDRVAVRTRLAPLATVDDISLFGTRLHVRGAAGAGTGLLEGSAGPSTASSPGRE